MNAKQAPKVVRLSTLTSVEVAPSHLPDHLAITFRKGVLPFTEHVENEAAWEFAHAIAECLPRVGGTR